MQQTRMEKTITMFPHNACVSRKLLVGEQVEVRQQEKGLRGSWHPATVVKLKLCRRVVEYDELLTSDGLNKLRECIPVAREAEEVRVLGRQTSSVPERADCGYIRPRPPPCFELLWGHHWTKGLLLDVFYEDAWWEGILLEDIALFEEGAKVRVFFPDEGDTLQASVKNIRLSQEWNVATGQWSYRGYWMLPSLDGEDSFCSLMETWRQKMRIGKVDAHKRDGIMPFVVPSKSISLPIELAKKSLKGDQKEQNEVKEHYSTFKVQKPGKMDVGLHLGLPRKDLSLESCQTFVDGIGQNDCSHKARDTPEQNDSVQIMIRDKKHFVPSNQGKCLPLPGEKGISNCSSDSREVSLMEHSKSLRKHEGKVGKKSLKKIPQNINQLGQVSQLKLKKASSANVAEELGDAKENKTGMRLDETIAGIDTCREDSAERDVCARYNMETELYNPGGESTFSCGRVPLSGKNIGGGTESLSGRDRLSLARYLAKMKLQDAGWRTEYRQRPGRSREAVYVSPDGCRRYWSLTSACMAWRKDQNISVNNWKLGSKDVRLWNTHDIRGGWISSKEPSRRRKTKKFFGWNEKHKKPSNRGHSTNCEKEDMVTALISSGNGEVITSILSTEPLTPDNNDSMAGKRQELRYSSTKVIPCKIANGIPVKEFSDKFPKKLSRGLANMADNTTLKHKIKCSFIMGSGMGLKNSTTLVDEGGTNCKGCLLSSNGETTLFTKKTRKRKLIVQDGLPLTEPKYKKSKTAFKKAGLLMKSKGTHSHGGCHMQVLLSVPGKDRDPSLSQVGFEAVHLKKSTVLSWLIDMGVLTEDERVCYISRKDGHIMKEGQVTREGVLCKCCETVFTLSNFESHSGSKLHRPCANIFLNDGRSLSRCQMQAWALQNGSKRGHTVRNTEEDIGGSDDTCSICGDGGELILCDRCPSTFHADCLGLEVIPEGDWFCPSCRCAACGKNFFDGDGGTFDQKTSLLCDQCGLEYHVECLKAKGMFKLDYHPEKNRFCGSSCEKIFLGLRGRVGAVNSLGGGLSWTLLRCVEQDPGISMEVVADHNSKLSVALGVMQECFVPMIDPCTKTDIISQVLYNQRSNLNRLNYHGFYTMLLERGDELISVATIRVHGSEIAEMPLIGTRFQYRRQGMCRCLMRALEKMLKNLGVARLILPAVPELLETWRGSFGFEHINPSERFGLVGLNLMSFPGTTILQKILVSRQKPLIERVPMEGHLNDHVNDVRDLSFVNGSSNPAESDLLLEAIDAQIGKVDGVQDNVEGPISAALNKKMDSLAESSSQQVLEAGLLSGTLCEVTQQDVVLLQGSLEPPAEQEFTWSSSLGRNKMKDERKFRTPLERSTAPVVESRRLDDDFYSSKVVLTTTRSKRLVKSCRWIADAIKELSKDAKTSRRIMSIEDSGSRGFSVTEVRNMSCNSLDMWCTSFTEDLGSKNSSVGESRPANYTCLKSQPASLKYSDNNGLMTSTFAVKEPKASSCKILVEEAHLRNAVHEDQNTIGNVYSRTRKRNSMQYSSLEDNNQPQRLQNFSVLCPNCVDNSKIPNSDSSKCPQNAISLDVSDSQITYLNSLREPLQILPVKGYPKTIQIEPGSQVRGGSVGGTFVGADANGDGNIIGVVKGDWNTKFYSRRRKRDHQSMVTVDDVGQSLSPHLSLTPISGHENSQVEVGELISRMQEEEEQQFSFPSLDVSKGCNSCITNGSVAIALKGGTVLNSLGLQDDGQQL